MAEYLPNGFRYAGIYTGVKSDSGAPDLTLIVSDPPGVGVGVYTKNLVHGAPVRLNRSRTPSESIGAVVINSGVANACTGEQGDRDAVEMSRVTAETLKLRDEQVLVMSTGVIGKLLPMDKIVPGISAASAQLRCDEEALIKAARGMMTTDTRPKYKTRQFDVEGQAITVAGLAKGGGMIGPNMATMLAVVLTDASLSVQDANACLKDAADESFNCISVEGHMSTSDSVLLLANGAGGGPQLSGSSLAKFQATVVEVCEDLAQSIPADGEGATHLITVEVHGCRTRDDAKQIARTIADSPLVKTAIAGNDPNWGRIVSAAGYAGVDFDPSKMSLHINGSLMYERGAPAAFDENAVSASMASDRNVGVVLLLDEGEASARFWTCDLTTEYVRFNAEYHT